MSITHLASGEVFQLLSAGDDNSPESKTLVRDEHFQVFRYALPAGKLTSMHQAAGIITIQCLSGEIELDAHQRRQRMVAGDLVYLADQEPHAVLAVSEAVLLISMALHRS
ncbi:MAG: cupin domain-containing protein [Thauera sp.]|jgi:quercetin dioxygenase-like cupin family protein|nr:cupin domain-containing protein [Thauera sp.]